MDHPNNTDSIAGAAVGTALTLALVVAAIATFVHVMGGMLTP